MQEFGGTGVSDVFTEFVARETNSKKRKGRSGIEMGTQILISAVLKQIRDFAAARSNRAAIACHLGVCARSVRADASRRGLR
jgi:hypothetical protein